MKTVSYSRKAQYTDIIEKYMGVIDESNKYIHQIIYPIINGYVMYGICHTNAFNIEDMRIDYKLKSSLTGEII
jgi:hypothetical protein